MRSRQEKPWPEDREHRLGQLDDDRNRAEQGKAQEQRQPDADAARLRALMLRQLVGQDGDEDQVVDPEHDLHDDQGRQGDEGGRVGYPGEVHSCSFSPPWRLMPSEGLLVRPALGEFPKARWRRSVGIGLLPLTETEAQEGSSEIQEGDRPHLAQRRRFQAAGIRQREGRLDPGIPSPVEQGRDVRLRPSAHPPRP